MTYTLNEDELEDVAQALRDYKDKLRDCLGRDKQEHEPSSPVIEAARREYQRANALYEHARNARSIDMDVR